jgi:hypothetical protein
MGMGAWLASVAVAFAHQTALLATLSFFLMSFARVCHRHMSIGRARPHLLLLASLACSLVTCLAFGWMGARLTGVRTSFFSTLARGFIVWLLSGFVWLLMLAAAAIDACRRKRKRKETQDQDETFGMVFSESESSALFH